MSGFQLLSAVFVDRRYDGKDFVMTDAFFADELTESEDGLSLFLKADSVGKEIMVVYTDIFGNDLTECFHL